MVGMLCATVAQGCLPTYACCGDSAGHAGLALLLLFRAIQGLCTGGEIGPLIAYFAETAPRGMVGTGSSLFLVTACSAFMISSSFVAVLLLLLDDRQMMLWGWRIPFLVSIIPGAVALWGRRKLPETRDFEVLKDKKLQLQHHQEAAVSSSADTDASAIDVELRAETEVRALDVVRTYGVAILIAWGALVGFCGCFYISVWSISLLQQQGLDSRIALALGCLMMLVVLTSGFICALISDRLFHSDPFPVMLFGSSLLAALGVPVFYGIALHPGNALVASVCISLAFGIALGASGSQAYLFCARLFPTKLRSLGFGLTFNIVISYLGGTASLVTERLRQEHAAAPGLYVSSLGVVSVVVIIIGWLLRSRGILLQYETGQLDERQEAETHKESSGTADSAAGLAVKKDHFTVSV
eukprot:TRINITY_DN21592_c0_g1_i2.p1 TRINITY_DN21592_c0_g1~~TRINITY_DN21592_c0_g1_i2.p1  ORF type:complete len:461 (-),score=57.58 TRINITY_DN21592_c0_g1_i2:255-1490(-)